MKPIFMEPRTPLNQFAIAACVDSFHFFNPPNFECPRDLRGGLVILLLVHPQAASDASFQDFSFRHLTLKEIVNISSAIGVGCSVDVGNYCSSNVVPADINLSILSCSLSNQLKEFGALLCVALGFSVRVPTGVLRHGFVPHTFQGFCGNFATFHFFSPGLWPVLFAPCKYNITWFNRIVKMA